MRILTVTDKDYTRVFELLETEQSNTAPVIGIVSEIIARIRNEKDQALLELTNKLDRNSLSLEQLKVSEAEIDAAYNSLSPELIKALDLASVRIHSYYSKLKPSDLNYTDKSGVTLGARWLPIESVGIYVPGGKAAYPSSVLMNAIPARVAGVKKIVMVTPAADGKMNPAVLAAAKICGISKVYRIGGAQAVAALAYGTQTIPAVDKIVGPGNAFVAEAKRQVFGKVGIDMIAGPSEILVIADEHNNPEWIAADLLSQAEHDETARSILITTSQNFAQRVISSIYDLLSRLERKEIARKSIETNGLVVIVESLDEAVVVANKVAPEHLELAVENPEQLAEKITNAGAIFLGRYTPEAIGDYVAGPSHVLPTESSCRFSSGLSVHDFLRRQSIIGCSKQSFEDLAEPTIALANCEGLTAHALSILVRNGE